MKHFILTVITIIGLTTTVFAQSNDHRKLAEEFLSITQADQQMQMMLEQMKEMQMQQIAAEENSEQMIEAQKKIFDLTQKAFSWDKVKEKYIDIYVQTFSPDDLKELIKFYQSPVGQKFLLKMPDLMTKGMAIGQEIMEDLNPEVEKVLNQYLKDEPSSSENEPSGAGSALPKSSNP